MSYFVTKSWLYPYCFNIYNFPDMKVAPLCSGSGLLVISFTDRQREKHIDKKVWNKWREIRQRNPEKLGIPACTITRARETSSQRVLHTAGHFGEIWTAQNVHGEVLGFQIWTVKQVQKGYLELFFHNSHRNGTALLLTFIKVRLSIWVFNILRKMRPPPPQVSINEIQLCHSCLEETRLDDAHFDTKVMHVPPGRRSKRCVSLSHFYFQKQIYIECFVAISLLKGCTINTFLTQYLRLSEKASTPHLERQYPPPVRDSLPRTLATFTTLPWAFFRSGRNWSVTSITPIRFTSKTFVKSSLFIHSVGPMGMDLPALFTSPHRPAESQGGIITSHHWQQISTFTYCKKKGFLIDPFSLVCMTHGLKLFWALTANWQIFVYENGTCENMWISHICIYLFYETNNQKH